MLIGFNWMFRCHSAWSTLVDQLGVYMTLKYAFTVEVKQQCKVYTHEPKRTN